MSKFLAKILIFVSTLFVFNQASADYLASLYNVDVLVTDEYAGTRNIAFERGLDEVFVRISGDSIVMDNLKHPVASRYVKQFSYEPVVEPQFDDEGKALTHTLKIQYNGNSMEKYLLDNGFAVWDKHRQDVVIWLVVRDGTNEYVLKDTDLSLIKTAANHALTRRGIPEQWPLYDLEDKNILTISDIRGGFKEPVIQASKRYSKGPALAGSIIWNGHQWQSSWSLLVGKENRYWSLDDVKYSRLLNNAIDQAADALGVIYAISDNKGEQQLAKIQLDIQAVNSIEKYRYVENYLAYLNFVERSRPLKIDNQSVIFEVLLRSSKEDFLRLIKNDASFKEEKVSLPENSVQAVTQVAVPKKENDVLIISDKAISNKANEILVPTEPIPVYRYKLMK